MSTRRSTYLRRRDLGHSALCASGKHQSCPGHYGDRRAVKAIRHTCMCECHDRELAKPSVGKRDP